MAQVPVPTAPDVQQSSANINPSPTPASFGASVIGGGLKEAGAAANDMSTVLGERAVQLQNINNQNTADAATHAYAIGLDGRTEQYKTDLSAALSKDPSTDIHAFLGNFLSQEETNRTAASEAMPNPMARQMFNQDSRRFSLLAASAMSSQTATAWKESVKATGLGSIQLNQGLAISAGGDPSTPAVAGALVAINGAVERIGALEGVGGQGLEGMKQKAVSPIYEGIFKQQVDSGDLDGARTTLAAHSAHDLTPEALAQMGGMLRVAQTQNAIRNPISQIFDQGIAPSVPNYSGAASSDATSAFAYYRSKGLSVPMAAGLAAQEQAESDNQPNPSGYNDGGKAYGAMQWHADRQAAFQQQFGHPIQQSTIEEQRDFAIYELTHGSHAQVGRAAAQAQTPEEASDILTRGYTTPADQSPASLGARSSAARAIADGTTGPATTFAEAPPKFAPDAEPAKIRLDLEAYVIRAAEGLYPNSAVQRAQFLNDARSRIDLAANMADENQKIILNTLTHTMEAGLPNGQAVHSIADLPASQVALLSPGYRNQLDYKMNLVAQGVGGFHTQDMTSKADALTTLSGTNQTQFLNTDLTKAGLSAPDFNRLGGLQSSMRRSTQAAAQREQKISTLLSNPIVKNITNAQFGQVGGPNSDTQPTPQGAWVMSQAHKAFIGALEGEVDRMQASPAQAGKPLTQEQIGSIAQNLLIQRQTALGPLPDYRMVPPENKAVIQKAFADRNGGRLPDSDEIARIYHQYRTQP